MAVQVSPDVTWPLDSATAAALKAAPTVLSAPVASKHTRQGSRGSRSSVEISRSPASPYDPLSAALSSQQARYTLRNPQSLKSHNESLSYLPGGNTRTVIFSSPFPITWKEGKGCELTSLDGDVYVDFLGEYTAGIYGHDNEVIKEAISDAMSHGWNFGGSTTYERELARKLVNRFNPSGLQLVRFTNSGTEANTMALAAAVTFTERKKILVFKNGYHGGTLSFKKGSDVNANLPHDFIYAPYNDIAATREIIKKQPEGSIAAILVELVQGSGGCRPGSKEFFQFLDRTSKSIGALFIVDEVMTSRLAYHGLSAEMGLKPDLITLGKWIGGGMTIGAFGGRKDIMNMFDPRGGILAHSGTFNNNVISMAAGCVGLSILSEAEIDRLNRLGESLKQGVEEVLLKHRVSKLDVADREKASSAKMSISGKGSMLNIHFSGESEQSLRMLFWHHMLEENIYIAQRGFVALNIKLTQEHVEKFVAATERFVKKLEHALS